MKAMVGALPPSALAELESAIAAQVYAEPSARVRRLRELGFLAELLASAGESDSEVDREIATVKERDRAPEEEPASDLADLTRRDQERGRPRRRARISRDAYDSARAVAGAGRLAPSGIPTSHTLVAAYGSWGRACRAAAAMRPDDGRRITGGLPWRQPLRRRTRTAAYTADEVAAAIRACALDLGRRPSSGDYLEWAARKQRTARRAGAVRPRYPSWTPIKRLFGSYRGALAAAALGDEELAKARARRFEGAFGIEAITEGGIAAMPLSRAAALAHAQGGSLDWLAGRARERGLPSAPDVRFNSARFVDLRRQRRIPEQAVRDALGGLSLGAYRRLLSGHDELTLAQVVLLASLVGVESRILCDRSPRARRGVDLLRPSPRRS
jgi:hypothetical protein